MTTEYTKSYFMVRLFGWDTRISYLVEVIEAKTHTQSVECPKSSAKYGNACTGVRCGYSLSFKSLSLTTNWYYHVKKCWLIKKWTLRFTVQFLNYACTQLFQDANIYSTFGLFQIQLAKAEVACCFSSVSLSVLVPLNTDLLFSSMSSALTSNWKHDNCIIQTGQSSNEVTFRYWHEINTQSKKSIWIDGKILMD